MNEWMSQLCLLCKRDLLFCKRDPVWIGTVVETTALRRVSDWPLDLNKNVTSGLPSADGPCSQPIRKCQWKWHQYQELTGLSPLLSFRHCEPKTRRPTLDWSMVDGAPHFLGFIVPHFHSLFLLPSIYDKRDGKCQVQNWRRIFWMANVRAGGWQHTPSAMIG